MFIYGFSHSLSRYKLKFSPDKLAKIEQDNILYAKTVKLMGDRTNAAKLDFSEVEVTTLNSFEEKEEQLREQVVVVITC
nr:probable nucleolar protein 5-2 [Ipomoea batatas]